MQFAQASLLLKISKDSKNEVAYHVFGVKKAILIPVILPPIEEQRAIVERSEKLNHKYQALEEEIKTSETNVQMLMQAVLKEAFESNTEDPTDNQQELNMGAEDPGTHEK